MKCGCTKAVHRTGFFGLGLGVAGSRVVNLKFPENIESLSVVRIYTRQEVSSEFNLFKKKMVNVLRVAEI
jgi:hypothetical protein